MKLFGFAGDWPGQSGAQLLEYAQSAAVSGASRIAAAQAQPPMFVSARYTAEAEGCAVAFEGEPLWPRDDAEIRNAGNPAAQVLLAYRRHGTRLLERLQGRFALAVVDTKAGTALLAIDRMGMECLAYASSERGIVFSASASAIARFPAINGGLRRQAMYDYLLLHMVPAPDTAFEHVRKLRPGTCAIFNRGRLEVKRYWQPQFIEHSANSEQELGAELKSSLLAAVKDCAPDQKTGAFLSGGLDSSSVAGMFAKVQEGRAKTFSMGFGVDAYDELGYARIANKQFGCEGHEYHVTADDIVGAFPKIAASYDEPFGNSSAVPTYICAKTAADHGMTHLLAGDGGDEIFGGNERYVRQRVFEYYYNIPGALRGGLIEPLTRLISPESPLTPLRKLRSYVDQASIRLPERLETWNLVYREGPAKLLDPEYLATIDPRAPLRHMREVFDEMSDASTLNKMLFYDWHYTLSDNDLRKVGTMCELAGIRVSYPMLDQRVVDLSLRVPSNMKIQGTELRSFYKKATTGFLPDEILNKKKHGFGLPFGVWLKTHAPLAQLITAHLESLRRRRIVSASFIDQIVQSHRTGDASFYGYPIWDMAMLDAWLSAHDISA